MSHAGNKCSGTTADGEDSHTQTTLNVYQSQNCSERHSSGHRKTTPFIFLQIFFTAVMKGLQVPSLKGFIGGDLFAGGLYFDTE